MMGALLQQGFVQNAFLAGTAVAIVAAVVGYFVILRALAFASESLSHLGFAGAVGASLFGLTSLAGAFVFTLLGALGIGILGERRRGHDIETGMVLSFALGLGVLFLGLYASGTNANTTVTVLFGSILSVTSQAVRETVGTGLLVLILLALLFRPLLFASIDPDVAQARGIPVRLCSVMFLLLLGITVATSIQVVGTLLVFALLLAPAATAQHWTRRPLATIALAVGLSLLFTWGGLTLAFVKLGHQMPVSFSISTLAALCYGVSFLLRRRVFFDREALRHGQNVDSRVSEW
ncbi:MAG TPA: metal ABC transporter permease [Ktedonobacteraceae bacterium]|nr:metal ABC transporter permease [Ktedonobacteraceae bacterium]